MKRFLVELTLLLLFVLGETGAVASEGNSCMRQFLDKTQSMEFHRSARSDTPSARNNEPSQSQIPPENVYQATAADGNAANMNDLGVDYAKGRNVKQNLNEALKWFYIAVRQSQREAQYNLGLMFATGQGVSRNEKSAATWFKKAAEQGDTEAQNIIGTMYEAGCGVQQSNDEAIRWYRLAAQKWYAPALENLGRMYLTNRGNPPNAAEASRWHALAVERTGPEAAYAIGIECNQGAAGIHRDFLEAAIWLRAAALQGHIEAAYHLGILYDTIQGMWQDPAEAAKWYLMAANHGHAESQYSIGLMYGSGEGVDRDLVKAYVWLEIASRQGLKKAAEKRDLIAKEMTRPVFYEAQRLKREMLQIKGIVAR